MDGCLRIFYVFWGMGDNMNMCTSADDLGKYGVLTPRSYSLGAHLTYIILNFSEIH